MRGVRRNRLVLNGAEIMTPTAYRGYLLVDGAWVWVCCATNLAVCRAILRADPRWRTAEGMVLPGWVGVCRESRRKEGVSP